MGQTSNSIESAQNDVSESVDATEVEVVIETKFTDINIDCQELILNHLSLVDLLNIADTSKEFKTAADLVFSKKFGSKRVDVVCIQPYRNLCGKSDETIEWIYSAKTCLQLLRNFGHLISILEFGPANVLEKTHLRDSFPLLYKCAITYINEYCAESLTKIRIRQCPKGFLKFLKPLPNVQSVEIDSFGFEGLSKDSMKILFPKLNRLIYVGFDQSFGIIEHHFPHLEYFCVRRGSGNGIVPWNDISPLVLELNPQLRSLFSFDIGCNPSVLRSIESLQRLEVLKLLWDMKYATKFNGEKFYFRTVKSLVISFMNTDRRSNRRNLPKIPFGFEQLEKCTINVNNCCPSGIYNFFDRNRTIVELNLQIVWKNVNLTAIAKALPSLRQFKLSSYAKITKKEICHFVSALQFLTHANFAISCDDSSKDLMESLGSGWKSSIEKTDIWTKITVERSA